MVWFSGRFRPLVRLALFATVVIGAAANASAQGVGVQGGVTIDPEQFFAGSHFETRALVDRLHFRPGIDGSVGDERKLAIINLDLLYKIPLEGSPWTLYQGTGPAIVIERFGEETDLRGGVAFLFGVAHRNGFFGELKVGAANLPNLKFGVGYTVR